MAIQFACPFCKTTYTVDDKNAGKKSSCTKCGRRIQVPAPPRNNTVLGEAVPAALVGTNRPASSAGTVPVICPSCGYRGEAAAHFAGSVAKCPKCATSFVVGGKPPPERGSGDRERNYDGTVATSSHRPEDDYRDDYPPMPPRSRPNPGQGLAIASLVLGICGIFVAIVSGGPVLCAVCCIAFAPISWLISSLGGLLGIIGTVLGFASRSAGNRSGYSMAGITTSGVAILFAIVGIVLPLLLPAAALVAPPPQTNQPPSSTARRDTRRAPRELPDSPPPHRPPVDASERPKQPLKKSTDDDRPAPARKTYSRDRFRDLVFGKTPSQVLNAVGQPDSRRDFGGSVLWIYKNTTINPATGKPDPIVNVNFEQGKVVSVDY